MNDFTPEQTAYLNWIRANLPQFYADVVQPQLSNNGLGNIGTYGLGDFDDVLNSITAALPSLTTAYGVYAGTQIALQQKTQQIATTTARSTNYLPWVIGGGALLLVAALAMR
jgi:hypothetical protein